MGWECLEQEVCSSPSLWDSSEGTNCSDVSVEVNVCQSSTTKSSGLPRPPSGCWPPTARSWPTCRSCSPVSWWSGWTVVCGWRPPASSRRSSSPTCCRAATPWRPSRDSSCSRGSHRGRCRPHQTTPDHQTTPADTPELFWRGAHLMPQRTVSCLCSGWNRWADQRKSCSCWLKEDSAGFFLHESDLFTHLRL